MTFATKSAQSGHLGGGSKEGNPWNGFPSPALQSERAGCKAIQVLDAVPAWRMRVGDAPLVEATSRPAPIVRPVWHIRVVDLQQFAGQFDRKFLRAGKIREHVVAGAVAADAPLDRIAVITH